MQRGEEWVFGMGIKFNNAVQVFFHHSIRRTIYVIFMTWLGFFVLVC